MEVKGLTSRAKRRKIAALSGDVEIGTESPAVELEPLTNRGGKQEEGGNSDDDDDEYSNDSDDYDDDDEDDDDDDYDKLDKKDLSIRKVVSKACYYTTIFFAANVFLFFIMYFYYTPAHTRAIHKKMLDEKLSQYADSLKEQKDSRLSSITDLTNVLSREKAQLEREVENGDVSGTDEISKANSLIDEVSSVTHEEVIQEKEKAIEELRTSNEQLGSTLSEKEKHIAELEAEMEKNVAELKKLQAAMTNEEVKEKEDKSEFCHECAFSYEGLHTTCGARLSYLLDHYKTPEDEAYTAVTTWDPNCRKKDG